VDKIRCALIGLGYWGPNLARNVAAQPSLHLAALCDKRSGQLAQCAQLYQHARTTTDASEILDDDDIDAVLVATPVSTHFPLALAALRAGKHVFVEKPLAGSVDEAAQLVEEARARDRVLMVDHVFAYTPAVQRVRALIKDGALGDLHYYDSVRINLGLFQHDVNVVWDLAVHDLAIMDYLIDERPTHVSAVAAAHVSGRPESMAYLTCFFDSGMLAHVHVNWLAPVKVRQTLIGGSRRMVRYDDLEPDEKIKVYDRGIEDTTKASPLLQFGYRLGDMWAPMLDRTEALANALRHFADCIRARGTPVTDGQCGLRVVRLLHAASRSAALRGQPVAV
jgi:predicted dehydrogenase